jgi:hypothetical protein
VTAFTLQSEAIRANCLDAIRKLPLGYRVTIREPRRSDAQNDRLWALLTLVSQRVTWDGERLTPEEFKDLFTASWRKQKVVRGIDGGLVFLGARTSRMSVADMSDLQMLIEAFCAERGRSLEKEAA